MRRALAATAVLAALLAGSATAASPQASCVGIITSAEGTTLPAGSVGAEVSGLARAGGLGALARELAAAHGDCG